MKTRQTGILVWTVAAGIVAGSLAAAPDASAQARGAQKKKSAAAEATAGAGTPSKDQLALAKKHYADGDAKFKAADYAGALVDFQAADQIKGTPQTARFIGLCQDNLGHYPEALDAYARFLANVPPKMAAQGDEITARVNAIKQMPAKVHVSSDPSMVQFSVDGKPQATPTPADLELPAGHHTLHFAADGHDPVDRDVDLAFASKQEVSVTLPASAAPPPVPVAEVPAPAAAPPPEPTPADSAPPPSHSNVAAWITGGAAVVAVGIGTGFGIATLNDKSNYNANPTTATADSGENHALIADMAFGVAVTLGVTSVVLFLSHDDSSGAAKPAPTAKADPKKNEAGAKHSGVSITPAPYVTAHGAGAGALVRF